ncbi:flagellar protein FlaG [Pontibacter sp. JAM-7]|uniref:flagellar protein FlaG n=1 Tax=Pontibacter sp. JAM-7 TaxID=3366581 RepID=UPI003AF601A8
MSSEIQAVSSQASLKPAQPQQPAQESRKAQAPDREPVKVDTEAVKEITQETTETIQQAVAAINDFMGKFQRTLNFSVDDEAGQTVIRVIDKSNDELIRQIPSEDFLKITQHIEQMQNLLFSEKA